MQQAIEFQKRYHLVNLISDPIHGYIQFTKRQQGEEVAEEDIIDTPWLQRLRRIHQMQGALWVFPSAQHSRFQHVLGAMHLAGRFGRHLYSLLGANVSPGVVEETLRLAGLLHDVGHGPFSHFFDETYLAALNGGGERSLTHESLSSQIVKEKLADRISGIRRSPSEHFDAGEQVRIEHICYLIHSEPAQVTGIPNWVRALKPLVTGTYSVDNLDYVQRDAYMCGLKTGVDVDRLLYYTTAAGPRGVALMPQGGQAFELFLVSRFHLYNAVCYHRTVRGIELHMREIFRPTVEAIMGQGWNPTVNLDDYLRLDDWSLVTDVARWSNGNNRELGREWRRILNREDPKWKAVFETFHDFRQLSPLQRLLSEQEVEQEIRQLLPARARAQVQFRVDLASKDARPANPYRDLPSKGKYTVRICSQDEPRVDRQETRKLWTRIIADIPATGTVFRVYSLSGRHAEQLQTAAERFLKEVGGMGFTAT